MLSLLLYQVYIKLILFLHQTTLKFIKYPLSQAYIRLVSSQDYFSYHDILSNADTV